MYKVIKSFVDLQDNGHKYNVGDPFPRSGVKVSDVRVAKLLGASNRQGTPLIKRVIQDSYSPAPAEKLEQGAPFEERKIESPKKGPGRRTNKKG